MHQLPEDSERRSDAAAMPPPKRPPRFLATVFLIVMGPFLLLLLIAGLLAMDDIGGPILVVVFGALAFVTYKCLGGLQSPDGSGLGWKIAAVALLIIVMLAYAYVGMGFIDIWRNGLFGGGAM